MLKFLKLVVKEQNQSVKHLISERKKKPLLEVGKNKSKRVQEKEAGRNRIARMGTLKQMVKKYL